MRSNRPGSILLLFLLFLPVIGCGGGGGSSDGPSGGIAPPPPACGRAGVLPAVTGSNVLAITVDGSLCSNTLYLNKPCVAVTVCTPGTTNCQTINDIVLDTASFGLRIFKQALSVPLTQATTGSGELAECIQFGDGSSEWGPVQTAAVVLGNEPAVQVPIHVIDSTFFEGARPAPCANADQSPAMGGFNGILGVGFFPEDCGSVCENIPTPLRRFNPFYYSCSNGVCSNLELSVPLASQVQNPVARLPVNNNGVIVRLPDVPQGGACSADGFLVLGIGTQANNMPSEVTTYPADSRGQFITIFNGRAFASLLDTGSNGIFFPGSDVLPTCASTPAWFCPGSFTSFSATNIGASGSPSSPVGFEIGNLEELALSQGKVFDNIGGNRIGQFIWGLPFYLGRTVYLGIQGKPSALGAGPYWAY